MLNSLQSGPKETITQLNWRSFILTDILLSSETDPAKHMSRLKLVEYSNASDFALSQMLTFLDQTLVNNQACSFLDFLLGYQVIKMKMAFL